VLDINAPRLENMKDLAHGDQAFEGRFIMCGNCGWQEVTKPGIWGWAE